MSFHFPDHFRFADTHEYAFVEGDLIKIGITAFAVDQLGDIVFVELPEVGSLLTKDQSFGSVESVKAVEDILEDIKTNLTEEDKIKAQNTHTTQFFMQYDNTDTIAESLGHFEINYGDFTLAFEQSQRYQTATVMNLRNIASHTFQKNKQTIITMLPALDET